MKQLTKLSLAFVIVVVASLSIGKCYTGERAAWEARVERVLEQSRQDRMRARRAEVRADSLLDASADRLRAAESDEGATQARVDTIRAETPEDLRSHPAILRRDSIIDRQADVITQTRQAAGENCGSSVDLRADLALAVADQCRAVKQLRQATADALERGDSLAAVLEDRPGERPWWLPKVGVGVAAGLDTQGRPNTVAGATISWEIKVN